MQSNDLQRIRHILRYCEDVNDFMKRFGGYQQFITDRAYHSAVSMCVLQIGELAGGLSSEFREETKDTMQWGLIRGMRNWIAHSYKEMDNDIIWDTISNSVPLLMKFCNEITQKEDGIAQASIENDPSIAAKPSVIATIRAAEKQRREGSESSTPRKPKQKNDSER